MGEGVLGFSIFFELWSIMCQNGTCGGSCITIVPQSSWRKLFLLSSIRSFSLEILSPLSNTWQMDSPLISYSKVCNILKSCNILGQIASFHDNISNNTDVNPDLFFLPQYDNRGSAADLKQKSKICGDSCIKMEKKEKCDVHQFVALQFLY